jgi:peptide/nickel transport system substrate-binding protein
MRWSKRELLRAMTAALTAICLITAKPTPASAQAGKYKESPALAEQVKAGKLSPVEQRLPEMPLVVPVVEKIGEFGGTWRRAFSGTGRRQ